MKNLKKYDAVVLNNTCSKGDHRNLFWDKLRADSDADSALLMKQAMQLEANLLKYVEKGGGLLLLHGSVTTQNNSPAFSKLVVLLSSSSDSSRSAFESLNIFLFSSMLS